MRFLTVIYQATALALVAPVFATSSDNVPKEGKGKALKPENDTPALLKRACPEYTKYASVKHGPYSKGPLKLSFQRPAEECRTFTSHAVEKVIDDITSRMVDKDLARLFENAYPNTLDTTVRWHVNSSETTSSSTVKQKLFSRTEESWQGPQSFIITGDIDAEWLRDSTNQLSGYQALAKYDPALESLIHGAINTQAEFVIQSPYCNAFQPPPPSGDSPTDSLHKDTVHPVYDESVVFECKYELDSLANFLALGNEFTQNTGSTKYMTKRWYNALNTALKTIDEQSQPTFNSKGQFEGNEYTFQRMADLGTETLNLDGIGNPLNRDTGLVRSAFRPSDDATIFGFLIPSNAMMAVELNRTAAAVKSAKGPEDVVKRLEKLGERITKGVWEHGVFEHKKYGKVFAFEVDGYGSAAFMDDANLPSLLSLPLLGFVDKDNEVYKNTRKMILSQDGNPYYLTGSAFNGIGGPHIGVENAWPMSVMVAARTSDSDAEITEALNMVRDSSRLGLVHESVNVNNVNKYTRPWFAWANSVFACAVLDIAEKKPEILFGKGAEKYSIADSFKKAASKEEEEQ
ncbi:hypothetical protein KEM54_006402 [Ascosphaera aggregata]|nr:hypothetical protein KEM54_006402 [Ascosphaera aggregata]